eukprot:420732_1
MAPITWLVCLLSTLVVTTLAESWACWGSPTPPEYIDKSQVCDGIVDCAFGEDDRCFICKDGTKITEEGLTADGAMDKIKICDGNSDCSDGSDEDFCYVCGDSSSFYNKDEVCFSKKK